MKKSCFLAISLSLIIGLFLFYPAFANGPEEEQTQSDQPQIGLASNTAACTIVQAANPKGTTVTLDLEWEGQVEEAFLSLITAGSEGGHSIYVNGQRVGQIPIRPNGQACPSHSSGFDTRIPDFISIPPEILSQGNNVITLTHDADPNDGWTAADLQLVIHGALTLPAPTAVESALVTSSTTVGAAAVVTGSVSLETVDDPGIFHRVYYQIPNGYTGATAVPLVILVHGMGGNGEQVINSSLAAEANSRGWLAAAPNMHGASHKFTGAYALAWPGAQHDIIAALDYMQGAYNVDPTRIYIAGGSMGGQTTAVMAAKYPDVFAAAGEWKGIADLADWYNNEAVGDAGLQNNIIAHETGGTPTEVPFEYERRSPMAMPQNLRLVRLKIWHGLDDELVEPYHSYNLQAAINALNPPFPVPLVTVADSGCTDDKNHCYEPELADLFGFLSSKSLSSTPPVSITIRTDESKPYYWLNITQSGNKHWTEVEASYNAANKTIIATVVDTATLSLGFNLGADSTSGPGGISRPGMQIPGAATTYLIKKDSSKSLANYAGSSYLNTTLNGQTDLTISAISVQVSANPTTIPEGGSVNSTITAIVKDKLNNAVPNGTQITFSTTAGSFVESGSANYVTTVNGGQATATVSTNQLALVTASVEMVAGFAVIEETNSSDTTVQVSANPATIPSGQTTDVLITATAKDGSDPLPNGTQVEFVTSAGIFLDNGSSTFVTTISGGQGKATATLRTDQQALVTAKANSVTGFILIEEAASAGGSTVYLPVILHNK